MISDILREAVRLILLVWARAVIVCLLMVVSLLMLGEVLQLMGLPILDLQSDLGWSLSVFLFNWLGWVVNYLAYAVLMGKMLADLSHSRESIAWQLAKTGMPIFIFMAAPSAFISTWIPDGDFTLNYVVMMVPQSLLDVALTVTAIYWVLRRFSKSCAEFPMPTWRGNTGRVTLLLVGMLAAFLVGSELLYTAIGSVEWQVMTGSDDFSAFMAMTAFGAAIAALYFNVVATPSLVVAWYRNLPSVKEMAGDIKSVFS